MEVVSQTYFLFFENLGVGSPFRVGVERSGMSLRHLHELVRHCVICLGYLFSVVDNSDNLSISVAES